MSTDLVAVEPFRTAAQRQGNYNEIARRMDYTLKAQHHRGGRVYFKTDSYRVKRDLGIVPYQDGHGRRIKTRICHDKALRYCAALDLLPTEVGL